MPKIKAVLAAVFLAAAVVAAAGCETTKGVGTGVVCTAQGAKTDSVNFWNSILKADQWMKKNLW